MNHVGIDLPASTWSRAHYELAEHVSDVVLKTSNIQLKRIWAGYWNGASHFLPNGTGSVPSE